MWCIHEFANGKDKDGVKNKSFTINLTAIIVRVYLNSFLKIGSGINYSVNELFYMFKNKFNVSSINVPDQPGNYRKTLRTNDDMLKKLNWSPEDRLNDYIKGLSL